MDDASEAVAPDEEEFYRETKQQEPSRPRVPTMAPNETAAKSCKITSRTQKHVSYTIVVEGVHEPAWKLKKTPVQRRFHDFQKLHHVMAKQAKANKLTPPPQMPDGGGAMMWFQRHSTKTTAKREKCFNQMLEYMINTPVINEHEAVSYNMTVEWWRAPAERFEFLPRRGTAPRSHRRR